MSNNQRFRELKDSLDLELKIVEEAYDEIRTEEEKKYFFSSDKNIKLKYVLTELLFNYEIKDTFEILEENDVLDPKVFLEELGFDLENKLSPLQHNQKINNKNTLILKEDITQDDLYKLFLTDNFESVKNQEIDGEIKRFLIDLYEYEKTEINAWFIEVIKNDFNEIKKMVEETLKKENNDTQSKLILQDKIFDLINQRGVRIGKEVEEPFKNKEMLKNAISIEFNHSPSGMPDIIYFPKDENKDIVVNNVSKDASSNHSFSILHHFYKTQKINELVNDKDNPLLPEDNVSKYIKKDQNILNQLNELRKQQKNTTAKTISEELRSGKNIEDLFNIDKITYTSVLNSSTLSIYKNNTGKTKDNEDIEEINVMIFLLSLLEDETKTVNLSQNIDEMIDLRIVEQIISKTNFGIASKNGYYTEIQEPNIENTVKYVFDFLSDKEKYQKFYDLSKRGDKLSNSLKEFMAKIIGYFYTENKEMLKEYQRKYNLFNKEIFQGANREIIQINKELEAERSELSAEEEQKVQLIIKLLKSPDFQKNKNIVVGDTEFHQIHIEVFNKYIKVAEERFFWDELGSKNIEKRNELEEEFKQSEDSLGKFLVNRYLNKKLENKNTVENQIELLKSKNLENITEEMVEELELSIKDLMKNMNTTKEEINNTIKEVKNQEVKR